MSYIHATSEQGKAFYLTFRDKGPIVMLNLLRFKKQADYSDHPDIKQEVEITGEEAYKIYMKETIPLLERAGSKLLYQGTSSSYLIGPDSEAWDLVLLVEHESVEKFINFADDKAYLEIAGHRTAALEDSRLLPILPRS